MDGPASTGGSGGVLGNVVTKAAIARPRPVATSAPRREADAVALSVRGGRDGPSRPELEGAAPSKTAALPSQTSSKRLPPHVPRVHDPPEDTEGFKLESRVKTDRAGSRASPAPGLRRSHVGPRRAAE